jgi:hypothetical protein
MDKSVRKLDYFDIFKDSITPYVMIEISKIKPNITINNAKDLEKEGKNIGDVLIDVKCKCNY